MAQAGSKDTNAVPDESKFRLLTVRELLQLPAPRWLIRPLFEKAALVVLYGPSGEGKSFLALAWALCVALGRTWMGYEVTPGPIVYIVGEGGRGICRRVAAWLQANNVNDVPGGFFILEAVQLTTPADMELLFARVMAHRPSLVIFDTFARSFDGDENLARDVGVAVASATGLIRDTGATVVFVHHTGKDKKDIERGSNAIRAAADTMILVRKRGDVITVSNTKQKDDEEFAPITLRLKQVPLRMPAEAEEELTSCILESADSLSSAPTGLTESLTQALAALAAFPNGASSSDWQDALTRHYGFAVHKRTFHNWRQALQERGAVEVVPDQAHQYRLTDAGKALVPDAA
ncbi:MAG TPA: AAA family ATPase [Vicinamibacterales bacterium]|nr:AAA family ATPase [Vicinamibacterales bacterium]